MSKATFIKSAIAAGVLMAAASAQAEVSANVGVTSNYLWRGTTQSNNGPSISGGVDYASDSGFYAGTWIGSIDWGDGAGTENDYYLGFGGETDSFGYDVGYILYNYPASGYEDSDFGEIYGSISVAGFDLGLAYTVNSDVDDDYPFGTGDLYYSASYGFDLPEDFGLSLTIGHYDFDVPYSGVDYTNYQVDLSKGDFTFTISKVSEEDWDDDTKFAVSWGTSF